MPTINGQELQHANTDVWLLGPTGNLQLEDFTKLSYKVGAEKKPTNDAQGKIDGFTVDNQKTEGSLTTRKSEWRRIKRWIADNWQDRGLGQVLFEISATFGLTSDPDDQHTEVIQCMIQEDPSTTENNQDALMVDIPLFVLSVDRKGEQPFIDYR